MSVSDPAGESSLSTGAVTTWRQREDVIDEFASQLESGGRPRIEDFLILSRVDDVSLLLELVITELEHLARIGQPSSAGQYIRRFPRLLSCDQAAAELARWTWFGVTRATFAEGAVNQPTGQTEIALPIKRHRPGWPAVPGFELLEQLGRGSMGVVYKARHERLGRLTALKLIRDRHSGDEERSRFLNEAAVIARLRHPGIIQIYEIGEAAGQPYMALEFIERGSLAAVLQGQPVAPAVAAAFVEKLARAIQQAHECGVVHRDLKPANILIDVEGTVRDDISLLLGQCQPKITDFGLAKQVDLASWQTETGAILGTPCYMSPEQARGSADKVGPASDLYALGAILYELLTGRPPLRAVSSWQTIQQLLNDEPVPPRRLQPSVPADLGILCLKCLEKDPQRRLASAAELADNLARIRDGHPITVRPVGRIECAAKWARRKPWQASLATASAIFVAVLAVLTVYLARAKEEASQHLADSRSAARDAKTQAVIAGIERDKAKEALALSERKEVEARTTADYLADLFRSSDPLGFSGTGLRRGSQSPRDIKAIELIAIAKERLAALDGQPLVQATAMDTLGAVYHSLGSIEEAEPLLLRALEIRRQHLPENHPEIAASLQNIGHLRHAEGKFAESESLLREALAIRRAQHGDDHLLTSETMFRLASCLGHRQFDDTQEAAEESCQLLKEVVRIRKLHFPKENDRLLGLAMIGIAAFHLGGMPISEVLPELAKAVDVLQASGAGEDFGQCLVKYAIAAGLRRARQYDACRQVHGEMLESLTRVLGERHPFRLMALADYAGVLKQAGDLEASEKAFQEVLELGRNTPLYFHPGMIDSLREFAECLYVQGRAEEAESIYREAIAVARSSRQQARLEKLSASLASRLREAGRDEAAQKVEDGATRTTP